MFLKSEYGSKCLDRSSSKSESSHLTQKLPTPHSFEYPLEIKHIVLRTNTGLLCSRDFHPEITIRRGIKEYRTDVFSAENSRDDNSPNHCALILYRARPVLSWGSKKFEKGTVKRAPRENHLRLSARISNCSFFPSRLPECP